MYSQLSIYLRINTMNKAFLVLLAVVGASAADAECKNNCNGHGECVNGTLCCRAVRFEVTDSRVL
jgi:hypothetical protein